MVEIESFDDRANAEILAASLRAGGLHPRVSETGPLGGMGMPARVIVHVPAAEADLAREVIEDGQRTAEKVEADLRTQWQQVPLEDLETGLETIRQKLRVQHAPRHRSTGH